ncbi:hypothetical protein A6M21_08375 [Desulfotomaculum copahuensis]|uniref:Pyridine nucleotide-disulfide oxidoreductase n=1 Tax=Desulfotomaculum copahuensis TaxID=1838280 RepID=A0A1B7LFQ6_9FIRM|nr:hypothetical protein A6M21_08375 [Desulfotomaculum copahuensis]
MVIAGNGVAAVTAAEAARNRDEKCAIHILGGEPYLAYYRPRLSHGLGKRIQVDKILVHPPAWYEERRIDVHLNTKVTALDLTNNRVVASTGGVFPFTALILAQGSHSFLPPAPGNQLPGVFTLRSYDDLRALESYGQDARRAVIAGGGPLGLEVAWALRQWGKEVLVLERSEWLLRRQLDERGAAVLQEIVAGKGVQVLTNAAIEEITGTEKVTGVRLQSGETLSADLVIFSTGVVCNTELFKDTGINVNRGVVVDEFMQTSRNGVYAAGDVAEFNGRVYGLWPVALEQGRVAGTNAAGGGMRYREIPPSNALMVMETALFSVGRPAGERELADDWGAAGYRKLFFDGENRLTGGILIGEIKDGQKIKTALEKGFKLPADTAGTPSVDQVLAMM